MPEPATPPAHLDPSVLDPSAIEMIEILAINFTWHMDTQIHPNQRQLAWDHFIAILQGKARPSQAAITAAMSDKPHHTGILQ
jgi:hypothetical protein